MPTPSPSDQAMALTARNASQPPHALNAANAASVLITANTTPSQDAISIVDGDAPDTPSQLALDPPCSSSNVSGMPTLIPNALNEPTTQVDNAGIVDARS